LQSAHALCLRCAAPRFTHPALRLLDQDIEHAAQSSSDDVRPGCIAAFAPDETSNDGSLVIVFELRKGREAAAEAVSRTARAAVHRASGLHATRMVAITEKSIPKTTSGKIRRRATRDALHAGTLSVVAEFVFAVEPAPHLVVTDAAEPRNSVRLSLRGGSMAWSTSDSGRGSAALGTSRPRGPSTASDAKDSG
jgi:hypothetical protein